MRKTIVIAEAGVNHNGDITLAKQLVDVAADAGADYVKFQTFKAEKLVSKDAKKAEYQQRNMQTSDDSQLAMLRALELSTDDHYILKAYAESRHIKFLSTGFDLESLLFLRKLDIDFFKVPSGELTNYSYLKTIASFKKPVVLSTGMAYIEEVKGAIDLLTASGILLDNITVLHCNTEYPTPPEDVNLNAMLSMGQSFNVKHGYSDHTLGIEIPVAAVTLGATVIEKHFTISRQLEGPDHKASLEPEELKQMVQAIRNIERALGDGVKRPSPSEEKNRAIARKSIFINVPVRKGEAIKEEDLIALRPGDGLSPMLIPTIVGKTAKTDLPSGTKLSFDHLL